jgi:cytosine deaminase
MICTWNTAGSPASRPKRQRPHWRPATWTAGNLVIPPFVEPHIHLDATLTAGEPRWNMSGTLFEGIECWGERKATITQADTKTRAKKTIQALAAHGIQHVRTHVDVTDPDLTALKAMLEVREESTHLIDLQIVAFPQEGIESYRNGRQLMEEAIRLGADVVGGIPTSNTPATRA